MPSFESLKLPFLLFKPPSSISISPISPFSAVIVPIIETLPSLPILRLSLKIKSVLVSFQVPLYMPSSVIPILPK
jgi:hypothetical protein